MDFKQLQTQLNQQLAVFTKKVNAVVDFVVGKIKNFKNITLGEQISYGVIAVGLVMVLISIVLFII